MTIPPPPPGAWAPPTGTDCRALDPRAQDRRDQDRRAQDRRDQERRAQDRRQQDRRAADEADLADARILVVDDDAALWAGLTRNGIAATHLTDAQQLLATIHAAPWDVVVAGPHHADEQSLARLADLRAARPDLGLVVTVNGREPTDLQTFVKARPDELVRVPVTDGALEQAIATTFAQVRHRRGVETTSANRRLDHTAPAVARVIAVTGPTGGSGKTMIALSLAHLAASRGAGRVVVADLDAQFGEVSAALQLRPTTTTFEVLFDDSGRRYDRRDVAEQIPQALVPTRDGFAVLAAPGDPVRADAIGVEEVEVLIDAAARHCDLLVLDCATGLGERTLAALDRVDHTVVVTQIDVPGIANLRTFLDTVDRLGSTAEQRTVVLNKELAASGVTGADVVQVLGPVGGVLPFEPLVTKALNEGRPMSAALPDHDFTRQLTRTLRALLPGDAAQPPTTRRRLLGRRRA